MKLKGKRFWLFEAMMALAAAMTVVVTAICAGGFPQSARDFADYFILLIHGVLLHTACGAITWAVSKSDKYMELSLTQVIYTSFLPLAFFAIYTIFIAFGGSDTLAPLFLAYALAWLAFLIPSGIAVMLCTGLYKVVAKRYLGR